MEPWAKVAEGMRSITKKLAKRKIRGREGVISAII
jgi:hypothetical protein